MKNFILVVFLIAILIPVQAQIEDDVATYAIPLDAIKVERQKDNFKIYEYYVNGQNVAPENLVGRETYFEEKLQNRALFKNDQLHSLQQSWSGHQLISEKTYRNGVRDGLFRQWDECGRLIAQDTIINGNGTTHLYDRKGLLQSEESFKDNKPNGLRLYRFIRPDRRAFAWSQNGKSVAKHYEFFFDGELSELSLYSKTGNDGYKIVFAEDGALKYKGWFIAGKSASEAEYSQAAKIDPELPTYFSEAAQYRKIIPADVRAIEQKYRLMPAVKIPLELDDKGRPRTMTAEDKRWEVLEYSIPADAESIAEKVGPLLRRPRSITSNNYVVSIGADSRSIIATETFDHEVLVKRQLFYPDCRKYNFFNIKHGVQREWYRNGQLKSEAPYWCGEMEGIFRHWNEAGDLIGQYEIQAGNGAARIYNSQGVLESETAFSYNRETGMRMILQEDGSRWFSWLKNGNVIGTTFLFHPDGSLAGLHFYADRKNADDVILHGPIARFDAAGNVTELRWFVNSNEVTSAEYSAAAVADATLPPYYADGREYKKYLMPEIKNLAEKYLKAQRVKIPLKFDAQGKALIK